MKNGLIFALSATLCLSVACGDNNDDNNDNNDNNDIAPAFAVAPTTAQSSAVAGTTDYTVTVPSDTQAYRITLVVEDNVTVSGGKGTFKDDDDNGAADAGASEAIALITKVNGTDQTGAKTVPAGTDDPSAPSGVFANGNTITFTVTGVAAGTVYPVVYVNGGDSTFLEIDDDGEPVEAHLVAGGLTIQ